jgi:hypothetical protein
MQGTMAITKPVLYERFYIPNYFYSDRKGRTSSTVTKGILHRQ